MAEVSLCSVPTCPVYLESKYWVFEGCVCVYCTSLAHYINEPKCKANMNKVKSSGMSRCAGITVPEVSKDHNVFFIQVLQKQYPSKCQELQTQRHGVTALNT